MGDVKVGMQRFVPSEMATGKIVAVYSIFFTLEIYFGVHYYWELLAKHSTTYTRTV